MDKISVINILKQAEFTSEFITYSKKHFHSDYKKKFTNPFEEYYLDNPIIHLNQEQRVNEALAQLVCLRNYYISKEIPLVHLYASIYDLSYRLDRYNKNYGMYGLSDHDVRWLTPVYRAKIFDLGSLRFEISGFSSEEIERKDDDYMPLSRKWKSKFPEGTSIITIHILKDTDFRADKIEESFRKATAFFAKYFPNHAYDVFVCRTWLLYGPTMDLLGGDSNIASFYKRFEIIAENKNTKQALDRIYGTSDVDVIDSLDKHSSLAKIAYKNLDKLGVAAGVVQKNIY